MIRLAVGGMEEPKGVIYLDVPMEDEPPKLVEERKMLRVGIQIQLSTLTKVTEVITFELVLLMANNFTEPSLKRFGKCSSKLPKSTRVSRDRNHTIPYFQPQLRLCM